MFMRLSIAKGQMCISIMTSDQLPVGCHLVCQKMVISTGLVLIASASHSWTEQAVRGRRQIIRLSVCLSVCAGPARELAHRACSVTEGIRWPVHLGRPALCHTETFASNRPQGGDIYGLMFNMDHTQPSGHERHFVFSCIYSPYLRTLFMNSMCRQMTQ